jgi:hypothetical protein
MATAKKTEDPAAEQDVPFMEELVTIKIPLTKDMQDDVYVNVNQKNWLIKRGEFVQVPRYVAEVLERAEDAERQSILFQEANKKSF